MPPVRRTAMPGLQNPARANPVERRRRFARSIAALLLVFWAGSRGEAAVVQVDDDLKQFPNAKFRTLQPAVDAAQNGDTVQVAPGVYAEPVRVNKTLTLLGAQHGRDARTRKWNPAQESLIIAGQNAFILATNDIVMDGFSLSVILDESGEGVGVNTSSRFSGYQILNNVMDADGTTALVPGNAGQRPTLIRHNRFAGRLGVAIDSDEQGEAHNIVVQENLFTGAALWFVGHGHSDLLITRNKLTQGGYILVEDSSSTPQDPPTRRVSILNNDLSGPAENSMEFRSVAEVLVRENRLNNPQGNGILVLASTNNLLQVQSNHISGSTGGNRTGTGIKLSDTFAGVGIRTPVPMLEIVRNDVRGFAVGIEIDGTGNVVQQNTVPDNLNVGILVTRGSGNNLLLGNEVRGNRTDCVDETSGGAETAGTDNTWVDNEGSTSTPRGLCVDNPSQIKLGTNLLLNADLKTGSSGLPEAWTRNAFIFSADLFSWDQGSGTVSIEIPADAPDDVGWIQVVAVQPNTDYLLEALIATEDVTRTDSLVDAGANLSILEPNFIPFVFSAPLIGDHDFTRRALWFNSRDQTSVTVALRLGIYAGTTTGRSWYASPKLRKIVLP